MSQTAYQRVDVEHLQEQAAGAVAAEQSADHARYGVRWLVLPLSILLCVAQSVLTIVASNVPKIIITSTMIPVLAFAVLFLLVLACNPMLWMSRFKALAIAAPLLGLAAFVSWLVNPAVIGKEWADWLAGWPVLVWLLAGAALLPVALRLVGFRAFNRAELVCLFAAMMVTAGISTFGLTEQIVPLVATPHNPEWNTAQRGWSDTVLLKMRPELYITDTKAIQLFREGVTFDESGKKLMPPKSTDSWKATQAYWWKVGRLVPWRTWIQPLSYWLILVAACYAAFYCLTYVVLGYWSDREKLIFPLAKLPEALLPDAGHEGRLPALLRAPGFWAGFGLSFLVLAWNGTIAAGWISGGLNALPLGMSAPSFFAMVTNTSLEGLSKGDFPMMFLIIFSAIGIAFLLPLEICFSIWFYFLVGKLVILLHVWLGYGRNGNDFPTDWLWLSNPMTAQGGGALFLFSTVSLFRCLRDYARLVAGRSLIDRVRIGLPVVGLVCSLGVVTLWLSWNAIGLFWAAIFVLILTILTVGLMRLVAEGGIYWFQSFTSFFHAYRMLGLGQWLSPALLGPLIPIYSVLFLDTKTFMAPNLLNAAAMRKNVGADRAKFHLNIVLCILVSTAVSLGLAIFLAHLRGAQQMEEWFYSRGPATMMDIARDASNTVAEFNPTTVTWWGLGAVWTALSMYLRTSLFWFPHPIGYIMLINPLMAQLWFSFFIGWVCKKITVRYGGKLTFDKVRDVFLGLILGELMAIFVWSLLSLIFGIKIGAAVTLNRYS